MAVIVRVRSIWNGFQGAPGYTNWYGISDGDSAVAAQQLGNRMRTFWEALKFFIPNGATIKVQRTYQVLDSISGVMSLEADMGTDPAVTTSGAAANTAYAAPVGCIVNWNTGLFNDLGHRIRGRTYVVPLTGNAFEGNGTLTSTFQSATQTAATAAVGGTGGLSVWTRPPKGTHTGGRISVVTSATVPDKSCVLRTRRD